MSKTKVKPLARERQRFLDLSEINLTKFMKGGVAPKKLSKADIQKIGYNKGRLDGFTKGYTEGKAAGYDRRYKDGEQDPEEQVRSLWEFIQVCLKAGGLVGLWLNFGKDSEVEPIEIEIRPHCEKGVKCIYKNT